MADQTPEFLKILQLSEEGKVIVQNLERDIQVIENEIRKAKALGIDTADLEAQLATAKEALQKMKQIVGS